MKLFTVEADTPAIVIDLREGKTQDPVAHFTRKDNTFDREEMVYQPVTYGHQQDSIKLGRKMSELGMSHVTINRVFNGERMAFVRAGHLLLVSPSVVETM